MAWSSLQHDIELELSASSFLQASVDVVLAFLVLICALISFITSSFVRSSGLNIPCYSCAHLRKAQSTHPDKASQSSSVVEDSSLTGRIAIALGKKGSYSIDQCGSSMKKAQLKVPADLTTVPIPMESSSGESLVSMKDPRENTDVAAGEDGISSQVDQATEEELQDREQEAMDREQEAIDREQDTKDRELMEALQAERETLAALYSELEKERNSSATAAREALAMISRLQEEKAAVQLEARQFQRMVLEKAMYDQEAIEVLNEILVKREEEKIALEEEIRVCRKKLDAVLMEERDRGEKVGKQTLLLQGTGTEGRASQKTEPALPIKSGRIGASPRVVKEEQSRILNESNNTNSHLLTAHSQGRVPEPVSNPVVESASFADGIHDRKAKIPPKVEAAPMVAGEGKPSLGIGSITTDPEKSLEISVGSARKQTGKLVVRNDEKADESQFITLKRRWSSRGNQEVSLKTLDKVKEDRRIEEKRLSVLEYVWKFEEQLQQQGGRPPIQVARPKSAGDSRSKTQSPVEISSSSVTARKAGANVTGVPRDEPLRRRLFAEGEFTEDDLNTASSVGGADPTSYEQQAAFTVANDGTVDDDPAEQDLNTVSSVKGVDQCFTVANDGKVDDISVEQDLNIASFEKGVDSSSYEQQSCFTGANDGKADNDTVEQDLNLGSSVKGVDSRSYEQQTCFTGANDGKADDDTVQQDLNIGSSVKGVDSGSYEQQTCFTGADDGKVDDNEAFGVNNEISEGYEDVAMFVHDVYEVQNPQYEAPGVVMGEVGGTSHDLSGLEMHQPVSDRLGKPDSLDLEEDDSRNKDGQEIESQEVEDSGTETQWEDLEGKVRYKALRISSSLKRDNSRTLVEEEVEQLTHRLKALEADRHLMKQTIESLRRENGEMKLLQEIAQQLRELRGMEQKELQLKDCLPLSMQFQAGASMSKKRRYNSTPRGSPCRSGTPASALTQRSAWTLLDPCTEGRHFGFHSAVS